MNKSSNKNDLIVEDLTRENTIIQTPTKQNLKADKKWILKDSLNFSFIPRYNCTKN